MKIITSIITVISMLFSSFSGLLPWNAVYYFDSVNGSDSNSGKSIEEPFQSLDKLNSLKLKSGNTVYIACGSEYRGQLVCQKGVEYASYGEGEQPTFLGSADASDKSKWVKTEITDVWVFNEVFTDDVGNIIFNAGEAVGFKQITGIFNFKGSAQELKEDLSFWHNTSDNKVYLCSEQNPAERFGEIEFALCKPVISLAKGVTVDGIRVLYGGAHGIKGGKINVTVRNCEVGWTGGSLLPGYTDVRYGNGIEFYADSNNVLVENCHVYQIYDAGITFQSTIDSTMKNITFRNNVIEKCTNSFEYYNGDGGLFKNILIDSNTFRDAGTGWGTQQHDSAYMSYTAHINSWNGKENRAKNFVVSNNILDSSTHSLFVIDSTAGTLPVLDSNTYIQYGDGMLTREVKFSGCEEYLKQLDPYAKIIIKKDAEEVPDMRTFNNPIADRDAPDPFVTYDSVTGYYYSLFTCVNRLEIFRSRHAANLLADNDSKVVFTVGGESGILGDVWAPEMHKAPNGKWYIYTSGTVEEGSGEKRLFVMESRTENPFDGFIFKGLLDDDLYAIDPTVYTDENGKQYICYSGCDGNLIKGAQYLVIQELENPWTLGKKKAVISKAEYDWERVPPYNKGAAINEGAFFVKNGKHLFIIYSGNGCWSDEYCLGVLEYTGGDMCSKRSWKKSSEPLFVKGNGVFGPGHASFFYSPDGSELWCAYHGLKQTNPSVSYAPRYLNLQKVSFDMKGYPVMGAPTGYETDIPYPSGEIRD